MSDSTSYLPSKLIAQLKPHQIEGLQFLWNALVVEKSWAHRGAILAHSMGLGKTCTTISFILAFLKHSSPTSASILVVAPKSILVHWEQEIRHWTKIAEAEVTFDLKLCETINDFAMELGSDSPVSKKKTESY
eukprot:PhF_6_TR30745/c0_g1_i1/m.45258